MNDTVEILAALWRLSREEAKEITERVAMLERAVMQAMAGSPLPGAAAAWSDALADAETAAQAQRARTARIAALIAGRAA